MSEPDWKGMAHMQIALGLDTPEALEMRGLVVASLLGLVAKSIRRKVMEVLDEVKKAHDSGGLVGTTKEAMKGL